MEIAVVDGIGVAALGIASVFAVVVALASAAAFPVAAILGVDAVVIFHFDNNIYVRERNSNFGIEDCFALNCTLKYCCISQEKKRTLRVKNCLYFDVELFLELMTKLFQRFTFNSVLGYCLKPSDS